MVEIIEKTIKRLFWVPFALGMIGYRVVIGLPFLYSVYASLANYFVNPVTDETNGWILAAQLLAVVVTTTFLLYALGDLWVRLKHLWINCFGDSVCVYGDGEAARTYADSLKHGYLCADITQKREFRSRDHVFLYEDEQTALRAYESRAKALKDKRIFMGLQQLDPFLLRDSQGADIHFFNVYEMMAREYWKQHDLFDEIVSQQEEISIAIPVFNDAGEAIFRCGYLYNVYSLPQKITYHLWGCSSLQAEFLRQLPTENGDVICVHENDWAQDIDQISAMSRIIITSDDALPMIQELLLRRQELSIHYYAPVRLGYDSILKAPALLEFGNRKDILTDDNIRRERLQRQAKLINYDYSLRMDGRPCPDTYETEMEDAWKSLDGFLKGSNAARADHYRIEKRLRELGLPNETLWEIEHIRWCRFHRLNHWEYAPVRDKAARKHPFLVPYEDLAQEEKEKDGFYDDRVRGMVEELL